MQFAEVPKNSQLKQDGFVYFAQARGYPDWPIKIGFSKNPWAAVFEGGSRWTWHELEILGVIPVEDELWGTANEGLEHQLHVAFSFCRANREWFWPVPSLLRFVQMAVSQKTCSEVLTEIEQLRRTANA